MFKIQNIPRLGPVDLLVGAFILSIPFTGYELSIAGIYLPPADLLLVAAAFSIGVQILSRGMITLARIQLVAFSCFTIVMVLAILSSVINGDVNRLLVTFLGYYLLFFLLIAYIKSVHRAKVLVNIWFIGAVLISVLTILSSVIGIEMGQSLSNGRTIGPITLPFYRTIGVDLTYGEYGMYVLATAPYFTIKGIQERSVTPLVGVTLILFSAFFSSQSRSTWLAVTGGFGALILIYMLYWRSASNRAGEYLLIMCLFIMLVFSRTIVSILIHVNEAAFWIRVEQYLASLVILLENPLFGIGLGNLEQFPLNVVPHNAFLYIGVFLGLPAMFLVISIFMAGVIHQLRSILANFQSDEDLAIGLLTGLIAVLIEAQFVGGFGRTGWALIAICLSAPPASANKLNSGTGMELNESEQNGRSQLSRARTKL